LGDNAGQPLDFGFFIGPFSTLLGKPTGLKPVPKWTIRQGTNKGEVARLGAGQDQTAFIDFREEFTDFPKGEKRKGRG